MGNKMLIDATHPEETRVVVLRGHRVEEFDYESASKKQLRGNIYLAKVTRVEPSLQAAFVNYGGNRHGFLAFSEIHPDYYQLPVAERQALKQEEARFSRRNSFDADEGDNKPSAVEQNGHYDEEDQSSSWDCSADEGDHPAARIAEQSTHLDRQDEFETDDDDAERRVAALESALPASVYSARITEEAGEQALSSQNDDADLAFPASSTVDTEADTEVEDGGGEEDDSLPVASRDVDEDDNDHRDGDESADLDDVESVGSEDAMEEVPQRNRKRRRTYKIQEVIKRGQIILVQVVKEERGNKGAALTTYLSLAGRYTVLMPNTASGGGISRKISSPSDRKRLREIAGELDVPDGMGLIIRTAGAARTKTEVKRDYEYLLRLWENVRDLTLKSTAPCLVYEEGDLIKRSIRDLYNREIDEILVAGDDAYRDAKDFMRMLMPSHAKNVQPYKEPEPLFTRHEVERQLNAMFSPQVTLPSGGYIIINQTEALVAIDVNSGKSTREYSIEDTALKTNLEAAEEISRQLRLRDLAGLIVVDFIDMEEKRNNRSVERKLKEYLRNDRARIQVGRISHFGLLEMSRQRIRTGMVEGSTAPCSHCQGTGFVRSTESVALSVLRSLEDWLRTNSPCDLSAVTSAEVALYILNQKRLYLRDIEARYGVIISVMASDRMHGANFYIEKVSIVSAQGTANAPITQSDRIIQPFEGESGEPSDEQGRRSRRRRRRRGGRGDADQDMRTVSSPPSEAHRARGAEGEPEDDGQPNAVQSETESSEDESKTRRRSRRRGRRGGRQQRSARSHETAVRSEAESADAESMPSSDTQEAVADHSREADTPASAPEPAHATVEASFLPEDEAPAGNDTSSFRSPRSRKSNRDLNGTSKANGEHHEEADHTIRESVEPGEKSMEPVKEESAPAIPKERGTKRGWWQRREV
jgi:ribonuclease E